MMENADLLFSSKEVLPSDEIKGVGAGSWRAMQCETIETVFVNSEDHGVKCVSEAAYEKVVSAVYAYHDIEDDIDIVVEEYSKIKQISSEKKA